MLPKEKSSKFDTGNQALSALLYTHRTVSGYLGDWSVGKIEINAYQSVTFSGAKYRSVIMDIVLSEWSPLDCTIPPEYNAHWWSPQITDVNLSVRIEKKISLYLNRTGELPSQLTHLLHNPFFFEWHHLQVALQGFEYFTGSDSNSWLSSYTKKVSLVNMFGHRHVRIRSRWVKRVCKVNRYGHGYEFLYPQLLKPHISHISDCVKVISPGKWWQLPAGGIEQ